MKYPTMLGVALLLAGSVAAPAQERNLQEIAEGLRASHLESIGGRAGVQFYEADHFDLSALPSYEPAEGISGTIRIGLGKYLRQGSVLDQWIEEFSALHPDVTFEHTEDTLEGGAVDLVQQRGYNYNEWNQAMLRHGSYPVEIEIATGSFNVPGWTPAFAIFVNEENPIEGLTMDQLDGIFGGPRAGGFNRTIWDPSVARTSEENIRTWGELGLDGEFETADIEVNGRPLQYNIQKYFERKVFDGGSIWNENLVEWAHVLQDDGTRALSSVSMVGAVAASPFGIVYADLNSDMEGVRYIPIAAEEGEPYVELTLDTLQDRSYPLYTEIYLYAQQTEDEAMRPEVAEFLRYVLSQEGQQAIQDDGKWLPLTAEVVEEQRDILEQSL